jgi:glycosyltransferase 2 family protein
VTARRRVLVRIGQVLLLLAIGWGLYRVMAPELGRLSWSELTRWRPAAAPLVASFGLLVAVYLAHALLWRRILADLGIARPTVGTTVRVYFLASLGRYLPGKLWQLAGLAVLAGRAGMPPGASAAAAVLGQFAFLSTGLLFLGLTLPEWGRVLDVDAPVALPLALGAALLVAGSAVLWLLVATPLGHAVRERMAERAGGRAGDRIRAAFRLADRVRPRDAALWAAGYAASWIALGGAFVLFAYSFHPAAGEVLRYTAGTVAAAYLAGYLFVIVPAGIGVREGAMLLLLQQIMPAGAALVVSALSRVWFTLAELVPLAALPFINAPAGVPDGGGRVEEGDA